MKILLLNPPASEQKKFIREGRCTQEQTVWGTLWPPISLATIAGILELDNNIVKVNDCPAEHISFKKLKTVIFSYSPQIVIWNTATPSINSDLRLAHHIKKINCAIKTSVFGTHVTALADECIKQEPSLDFIIRNEPEFTIRELIQSLKDGGDLKNVRGISFRTANKDIVHNPDRPYIEDLDILPFPAWHLININSYRLPLKNNRFLIISPIRGCPYKCIFCTAQVYYGKKIRCRSIEKVISEIKYNKEKYNVKDFLFWAETFTIDNKYVEELCSALINNGLEICWTCNSRVDTVTLELLKLMKKAGCWMISYGIESGEQYILSNSKKSTKVEQAIDAILWAKTAGIYTVGHFILGLPGETDKTIKNTIDYAKRLELDLVQFYSAVPFPGSELYTMAVKNKWIDDMDFSCFKQDNAVMKLPSITAKEVNEYRKIAYRAFYKRTKTLKVLLKLLKLTNIQNMFISLKRFLKWSK